MWAWVIGGLVVWALVAVLLGVVIGRGIRIADGRSHRSDAFLDLIDAALAAAPRTSRRRVALPPVGVGLAAAAVGLETVGYVTRLVGATGPVARVLSMDAPYALPRMYVAALFAAAAVAAVAGAARIPGRRSWWLSVGLVSGAIAGVKAGGTVHASAMADLASGVGTAGAVAVSGLLAVGVLAVLALLSRAERRDRRRVLGCLTAYAAASVGLSAVAAAAGASWAVTATYLEESGEALAGVALLVAVLLGVAPRLVLPASWVLRREADAQTLEVRDGVPGTARE